ncbi:MAG: aminoacyl-tRNA hydrolase [Actinobacteria bacterium]|nr:aminoacyl-tRNA hydrolase [Actinomycetota bacterium]
MSIRVNRSLVIPDDELELAFSASGGPGGQHANRSATRVELTWNVENSRVLGPRQRERILRKLAGRIDGSGSLRVQSGRRRSQLRNREEAEARLADIVAGALRSTKRRIPTKRSASANEARLAGKKHRSQKKARRRIIVDE